MLGQPSAGAAQSGDLL